jgi:NAD(P)-dependent dehydrogenase (short-subunit alcohol dehydrogenase family)
MGNARVDGLVVVVTGAGSGIGRATARLFGRLGAKVHVVDVDAATAITTRADIEEVGGRARDHAVDVTDAFAVMALADRVYAEDGRVDVLHNNAGIAYSGPVEETTLEDWQRVISVNLLGVVHGMHAFVPKMLEQGGGATIVNTASIAGLVPAIGRAPYCASKYGVVGLTKAMHGELAPRGVHVAAVCPGVIATNIARSSVLRGNAVEARAALIEFYDRRGTSPEAVAEAVIDAVEGRWVIRVVPRSNAVLWAVERLAPGASQALKRSVMRVVAIRGAAARPAPPTDERRPMPRDRGLRSPDYGLRRRAGAGADLRPFVRGAGQARRLMLRHLRQVELVREWLDPKQGAGSEGKSADAIPVKRRQDPT